MGSFVRGSVASFRITEDFNQGHLDYLNASGGSKSTRLAKYCSIGLRAEMDEAVIINAAELPMHIRDWLSEAENVQLLVNVLSSTKTVKPIKEDVMYVEPSKPLQNVSFSAHVSTAIENPELDNSNALNDFIQHITGRGDLY